MGDQDQRSNRPFNLLVRSVPIFTALLAIITPIIVFTAGLTADQGQIIFSVLNLIPLFIFWFTKPVRQEFIEDSNSRRDYSELFGDNSISPKEADRILDRVNILVEQLHTNIARYALFLIIVYGLYMIDNKLALGYLLGDENYYERVHPYFNIATGAFNYLSAVFLFLGFKVLYAKTVSDDGKNKPLPYSKYALPLSVIFLTFYIAISLVLAVVLSLEKPDRPPSALLSEIGQKIKTYEEQPTIPPADFINRTSLIIELSKEKNEPAQATVDKIDRALASYKTATDEPALKLIDNVDERIKAHRSSFGGINDFRVFLPKILQLLIGLFNGLAMSLIFGRYISMEHAVYNMKAGPYNNEKANTVLHVATIYILPLYVLAQPLFGSFGIDDFGDPKVFSNGVFFVCWIGKTFFLYLTYLLMKRRLMHLYLHSVVVSHGIPPGLAKSFKSDF